MAHFARIEDGIVTQVIVVKNCAIGGCVGPSDPDYKPEDHTNCGNLEFPDTEPIGQRELNAWGFSGEWRQTSYNAAFRGKYAGPGDRYDEANDTFLPLVIDTVAPEA